MADAECDATAGEAQEPRRELEAIDPTGAEAAWCNALWPWLLPALWGVPAAEDESRAAEYGCSSGADDRPCTGVIFAAAAAISDSAGVAGVTGIAPGPSLTMTGGDKTPALAA
jgi:hypothetical protein